MGIRPYFVTMPVWMIRRGAKIADHLGWAFPGAPGFSWVRAARLGVEDNPYPAETAREVLGWSPPYSLEEALKRTGQWLREKEAVHAR
jgi:nucleoside-diphosphate-sugar epimerase